MSIVLTAHTGRHCPYWYVPINFCFVRFVNTAQDIHVLGYLYIKITPHYHPGSTRQYYPIFRNYLARR